MEDLSLLLCLGLALPFLLVLFASESAAEPGDISVHHEWGRLREVIVGQGQDLVIPSYNEAVSFIYDPKYIGHMKRYGGRPAS